MMNWIGGILNFRFSREHKLNTDILELTRENQRLKHELERHLSNGPADYRYWEGRYRDEKEHNDRLVIENNRLRSIANNAEMDGPKRDLEKANDAQAARAMSRNTKVAFQQYQAAVTVILDRIDELGKKNHVTKEDLRKLRDLRRELSAQIRRTI